MSSSVGAILLAEACGRCIAIVVNADLGLLLSKLLSASASLDAVGGSGLSAALLLSAPALLFCELDLGGSSGNLLLLDEP